MHLALVAVVFYGYHRPPEEPEAITVEMAEMQSGPDAATASASAAAPPQAAPLPTQPLPVPQPVPQPVPNSAMPPMPHYFHPAATSRIAGSFAGSGSGLGNGSAGEGRWHFGPVPFPEQQRRHQPGAVSFSSYTSH